MLSRVRLVATPWTVAHQAPLSMGFSRQECWSGLTFPLLGDLPDPGIELTSPMSPAWVGGFFTAWAIVMFLTFRDKCWRVLKFQKALFNLNERILYMLFFFLFCLVFQVTESLLLYVIFVKFFYRSLKFNYFFQFCNFHFLVYRKSNSGLIFHLLPPCAVYSSIHWTY